MKHFIAVALVIVFTCGILFAGDFRIGTGTSTENYVPFYGYNNYGWSKFFYTSDELTAAGMTGTESITKIAFKLSGNTWNNYVTDNQQIYCRHFYDQTYASSAANYPGTSGYTQVFSGSIAWNGPGWVEITFGTPFNLNTLYGIEILWENRDGSKLAGPPKFCYTSTSSNYRAVYKYSDTSFPTTSGTRYYNRPNIWFMTPVTDVPPPAEAVSPADAAAGIEINSNLVWNHTGGSPTGYRLWLGTNNPPSNILSNLVVTSSNYDPAAYFEYDTTYYWRVVPFNDFGNALDCPVWSFTTRADPTIYAFPYTEAFDGTFNPTGWTDHSGGLVDPIVLGADESSQWQQDDWLNIASTDKAAKMNIWGSVSGYFISPLLNISSDNFYLEFDLALLKYGQPPTGTPPATNGIDDRFAILVSDGFSWNTADIIREWNNTGSDYVLNDISVNGTHVSIPLAGLTGRKRIAFFAGSTTSNADNDIMINNMVVKEKLPTPTVTVAHDPVLNVISLSWAAIPNANSYLIYRSTTLDGTYDLIGTSGTTSFQTPSTDPSAFYKVIASSAM